MSSDRTAGREIRAVGPRPQAEALRAAYLDLLKLSLCDLVGVGTESVYRTFEEEPRIYSRELPAEQLGYRVSGRDWPLHALTMIGLQRLDDLQDCVESVVADGVEGDLIEAGTWRGGASILMRATLDSLGAGDRTIWLADSFEGFPTPDPEAFPEDGAADDLSPFDFLAAPVEQVREHFARLGYEHGIEFVPGFFDETMPGLRGRRWSLIRLDGDTYESTSLALESLYPGLAPGGYLIVDDYHFVSECRRAVDEFRARHGIEEPLEQVDWSCMRWRRQDEGAPAAEPAPARRPAARGTPRSAPSRTPMPIPSVREVELERELDTLRERLRAAESEIERIRGRAEA
jgi:O-methyltransferase